MKIKTFREYLNDCQVLGQYLMESMNPGPLASEKRESIDRKERQSGRRHLRTAHPATGVADFTY